MTKLTIIDFDKVEVYKRDAIIRILKRHDINWIEK